MIKINNLHFKYGKHQVLKGINLTLQEGNVYGLLGQNGVGKSTLLKIMSGLLKVENGSCAMTFNSDGKKWYPYNRQPSFLENIYYIPEDFAGPDIPLSKYAESIGVFYPNYNSNKFYKICEQFDINVNTKFTKISYGQQKKGIIAFALALGTKILLMDEPSNGLDIPSKMLFRQAVAENISDNQIVVISTHQVRDLESLIDPIIILDHSEVLLNESIANIEKKLYFNITPQKDNEAIYSENNINGFISVRENKGGEESNVNIETLFNCTLANKSIIKNIFSK